MAWFLCDLVFFLSFCIIWGKQIIGFLEQECFPSFFFFKISRIWSFGDHQENKIENKQVNLPDQRFNHFCASLKTWQMVTT